jgi:hypothetical protein
MFSQEQWEIAHAAARLIAEEGLAWGPAKQRALRDLALPPRSPLPPSDLVETALREYLAIYQADTQPAELRALRELALVWMDKLAAYSPMLTGAAWRGTANQLSDLHLQLFSDDPKAPEIALFNLGESPDPGALQRDPRGRDVPTMQLWLRPPKGFGQPVGLHLAVLETVEQRSSRLPDAHGLTPRGDAKALRRLLEAPP